MNWDEVMDAFWQASKSPDMPESVVVAAAQELADVVVAIQRDITEQQMAVLIGVGAILARQGLREMQAEAMFKRVVTRGS